MTTSGGTTNIIGGVHTQYQNGILTESEVLTGALTTAGTYTWPTEKWAAWGSYVATRTAADVQIASTTSGGVISSAAGVQRWAIGAGTLCGTVVTLLALF